jgi:acyl carrier protein
VRGKAAFDLGGVFNRLGQWSGSTMMPETDPKIIAEKLCQYARANFVAEGVDFDETSPLGKAGIDSFSLVELLLFCERTFGVRVPDSHLTGKNLASMNTLAGCIAELARNNH